MPLKTRRPKRTTNLTNYDESLRDEGAGPIPIFQTDTQLRSDNVEFIYGFRASKRPSAFNHLPNEPE